MICAKIIVYAAAEDEDEDDDDGVNLFIVFSGGKDSCYNMMQCVAEGHDIVALANLKPKGKGWWIYTSSHLSNL